MIAIIEILFLRDSCKNHSHMTLARYPRLQSYLVLIETHCNRIWSALDLRLQSYQVLSLAKIAIIFGPQPNFDCNHIWSTPKNCCNHMLSSPISAGIPIDLDVRPFLGQMCGLSTKLKTILKTAAFSPFQSHGIHL